MDSKSPHHYLNTPPELINQNDENIPESIRVAARQELERRAIEAERTAQKVQIQKRNAILLWLADHIFECLTFILALVAFLRTL